MKLKLNVKHKMIICICLLSLCNLIAGQLFDVVGKDIESPHQKKVRSLFDNYDDSEINFNQMKEKLKSENKMTKTSKNKKTKSKKSGANTNSKRTQSKSLLNTLNEGTVRPAPVKKQGGEVHSFKSNPMNAYLVPNLQAGTIIPNYKAPPKPHKKPAHPTEREEDYSVSNTLNKIFNDKNSLAARINFTQKEIKELKSKVTMLMEINSKLSKKVKKNQKLKKQHKRISSDIVSFIQKNEGVVNNKKNEISKTKSQVEIKLSEKEKELKALYDKATSNFSQLQTRLEQLKSKLNSIKQTEANKEEDMKGKMELKNFEVKKRLDVDGSGMVNQNIVTKGIVLDSLKMDSDNVTFYNDNTKFIIGTEIINMKDIFKNYLLLEKLNKKCGIDMNQCKILSKEDLMASGKKQEKVLENLQMLNEEAEKIIKK